MESRASSWARRVTQMWVLAVFLGVGHRSAPAEEPPPPYEVYTPITKVTISSPNNGDIWAPVSEHNLTVYPAATDTDRCTNPPPGQSGEVTDTVSHWWTGSGGTFRKNQYIGESVWYTCTNVPGDHPVTVNADDNLFVEHYYEDGTDYDDKALEGGDDIPTSDNTDTKTPIIVRCDIDIWNGQSGPMAPDETDYDLDGIEDEEDIGAFTVANLNDTNGDGHPDNDDSYRPVVASGTGARDEIDLMKIVLHKPEPAALAGSVRLVIEAGDIKIWDDPVKTNEITDLEFSIADCPAEGKTWYVEARAATSLQGISLRYEVKPTGKTEWYCPDRVTATGVWATCTRKITDYLSAAQVNGILQSDPQYNEGGEQGGHAIGCILSLTGGTGVGRVVQGALDVNCIVIEFGVTPDRIYPDVPETYGDDTHARPWFDVTRQRQGAAFKWWNTGQEVNWDPDIGHRHFPERDNQDNELANDDSPTTDIAEENDENDEPTDEGRLWSIDAPGSPRGNSLRVMRMNFLEFVRMGTTRDPGEPPPENPSAEDWLAGSRCSPKEPWSSKLTRGHVTSPNALTPTHFAFQREVLDTELSVIQTTPTCRHLAWPRGLEIAANDGLVEQEVTIRLIAQENVILDEIVDSVFGQLKSTLAGDLVAYGPAGHLAFASRINGHIVGRQATASARQVDIAHELVLTGGNILSPEWPVEGTVASVPTPDPGAMNLGEITSVTVGDMVAEADSNDGGNMAVTVEIDDYNSWPYASKALDIFTPHSVPLLMYDPVFKSPVQAIKRGVVSGFALTGYIAGKADGTVIGPDGSSGANTAHICVYVKDFDGNWVHSGYVSRTGPTYTLAAPGIGGTTPIPVGGSVSVLIPGVYTHASAADPGNEDEDVEVEIRDWDGPFNPSEHLQTIYVSVPRPNHWFPGALIGPQTPDTGELSNPAPGGIVWGPLGSSYDVEAEVFYRIKDHEGDMDSATVPVRAVAP